jgi:flagellar biosynthesis protein FlhB
MAEKTHDPTPKRIRDARARGEVPRAPLVAGAIGLIALVPLGKNVVHNLAFNTARSLMDVQPVARIDAWSVALAVIGATAPVALVLIGIAAIAGVAQGSITFSPSRLAPDPSKLEPFGGLRRLFDKSQLWNAFRGLCVALLLTWVLGRLVWTAMISAARAPSLELAAASASRIVLVGGAIAVLEVEDVARRGDARAQGG